MYDCTEGLTFYLVNTPQPSTPVVVPPAPVVDPVVAVVDPSAPSGLPSGDPTGGSPIGPIDPIGLPGGGAPGGASAVPEPSTWAMLLLGFAGLGYAASRRSKTPISALACQTTKLTRQRAAS
jgi:hypothetical protein